MQIGKVSLNVRAIADIKEQDFYDLTKGHIDIDKKEAWLLFSKEAEPFKKKEVKSVSKTVENKE